MTDKYISRRDANRLAYSCGLAAGDRLHLERRIVVRDHNNRPTGEAHEPGEEWLVLAGWDEEPDVIWLQQPNGDAHTWDDDESLFEFFRKL